MLLALSTIGRAIFIALICYRCCFMSLHAPKPASSLPSCQTFGLSRVITLLDCPIVRPHLLADLCTKACSMWHAGQGGGYHLGLRGCTLLGEKHEVSGNRRLCRVHWLDGRQGSDSSMSYLYTYSLSLSSNFRCGTMSLRDALEVVLSWVMSKLPLRCPCLIPQEQQSCCRYSCRETAGPDGSAAKTPGAL